MTVFRNNARVLITGATSGLGREMARQLGARACRVALTGRRRSMLDAAAEACRAAGAAEVLTLLGSVTEPEVVHTHAERLRDDWGGVDVAILNAGIGDAEHGRVFDADVYRRTFDTNVLGVCLWLEELVPIMIAQRHGVIAGISSPAGWRGLPKMGAYSASKAAVSSLLESLRVDLRGTGVDVVDVCPGFVKSEMTARNDPKDMVQLLETPDGARRILGGIERRQRIVHFPFPMTTVVRWVIRLMPGWLYDRVAARVIRRNKQPYVDVSRSA